MEKGFIIKGIQHYTPKETYELSHNGAVIVDVREAYMNGYKCFDVEYLCFCPFSEMENYYKGLNKDKLLIFADASGMKSIEAVNFFAEKGFTNVANMTGGLVEWERVGLPILTNIRERLRGSCMCQIKYRDIKQ